MLQLIYMEAVILLSENVSVEFTFLLKLLIVSYFTFLFAWTIFRKYMINRLIHDLFHISPGIIPRLRLGLIWRSRDDTRADMEKVMY